VYLKRLEIQGFKTFATRTVFEFRPGITAVVGPNGSGKSNIADAVRWVLGEQSYAALRSKRTEDLLFSGGGRRAPAGLAEVSLTVDNSDRLLPLPYGEVTITRRATRAGENEYFINRNRVRLRDIQEAVGPLGGSYTIINQGLVDAALTLRPEERRRLFEDAAEISVFESRKHDAERKLRETETNLERCADVLTELEPRLRSLKRQASLARSYRDLTDELRGLLLRHYAVQWRGAQQALAVAEANEQSLAGALQLCHSEQAAATAALRAARDQLRTLRERLGTLHAESSALHTQAEAVQRDLAVGNERQAALIRRGEEFERSLNEFDLRREELERERATVAERLAAAETRLAEQRAAVSAIEGELAEREAERRAAQRALDAAQRAELEATAALAERRRRAEQLAAQSERLVRERAGSADVLAAAERTLAERKNAVNAAQERLAAADQAANSALAGAEQARGAIESLRAERARAEEALAQARRALADTEARLDTLARLQRSYAGAFAGVKAAMQWAEVAKRPGFTLVSSIIRTPAQIETAIEVALGSRLQNIVVERWGDAEDAIEALKKSGAGRATFLPLDTIRTKNQERAPAEQTEQDETGSRFSPALPFDRLPFDPSAEFTLSGAEGLRTGRLRNRNRPVDGLLGSVLGVAAELVDYDDHYRAVAWQLLGRTLVVRDLATARQTLRQLTGGWTIVTLAGEQVNSGGAVTGGAQTKETGTLRRERELRELPEQIDKQHAVVEQAAQARAALDTRMSAAERAVREAESARQRAGQELDVVRGVLDRARRAADQAETDLDLQRRRHDQAAAAIQDLKEQHATLHEEQVVLEAREAEARTNLEQLRAEDQGRLDAERQLQQRAAALRAAVAAAEGEARAERTLLQSNNQNLARLADQRAAGERRLDELAGERATLDAQLHALQGSHARLLEQIDDLRGRIGPSEAEQIALEATQSDLERQESELTSALLAAESTHSRAAVEVQRTRDRLDTLWERAAADDIDIESVVSAPSSVVESGQSALDVGPALAISGDTQSTTDQGPQTTDNEQTTTDVDLETQILAIKSKIQRLGVVNPLALEEYEEESRRHSFMTNQISDLRQAEAALRALIVELDSAMQMRFEATFRAVAAEFERSFTRLFGGGQAQLLLTRPDSGNGNGESHESVEGMGVEILARPPGKRQQTLSLLSGGERTLTASALLFAILKVNPSPFCVLDEVDAALDEANVGRFREALADLSEQTQFLLVTHNRGTIEAADTIYGVSMGEDGASRVLSLRIEELIED
jgi:chromosome segregation protein